MISFYRRDLSRLATAAAKVQKYAYIHNARCHLSWTIIRLTKMTQPKWTFKLLEINHVPHVHQRPSDQIQSQEPRKERKKLMHS